MYKKINTKFSCISSSCSISSCSISSSVILNKSKTVFGSTCIFYSRTIANQALSRLPLIQKGGIFILPLTRKFSSVSNMDGNQQKRNNDLKNSSADINLNIIPRLTSTNMKREHTTVNDELLKEEYKGGSFIDINKLYEILSEGEWWIDKS